MDICVYQEGEDCYDECVIDHPELIIIRVTPLFASLITTSSNYENWTGQPGILSQASDSLTNIVNIQDISSRLASFYGVTNVNSVRGQHFSFS